MERFGVTALGDDLPPPAYRLHPATAKEIGVVASLPHSGEAVPAALAARMTPTMRGWLRHTDWFLPALYAFLPGLGVPMIEATHSRYVADPNRRAAAPWLGPFFRAPVAASTPDGAPVYDTPPHEEELAAQVAHFHGGYHAALAQLLDEARAHAPQVVLLDLHSFMTPGTMDVCLGSANGQSCAPLVAQGFAEALRAEGFSVTLDAPFNGGHVIRRHGDARTVHALQIELRYPTYLDATRIDEERPRWDPIRAAPTAARLQRALAAAFAALAPSR